jgi:hypothetical protein
LLSAFSNANLPGKTAAWIGNGDTRDATGNNASVNESYALFLVSRTVTLTTFHARIAGGTASSAITFQVFDSSGVAIGSGPTATCVIPSGGSSVINSTASITLTGPALYAVKATSGSGNLPGREAFWALGN